MEGLLLTLPTQFRIVDYTDHIWALIIGGLITMMLFYLIGQAINLIDRYNRTRPIIYEQNGKRFTIPQHIFVQLPAAITRELFKHITDPISKQEPNIIAESAIDAIDLPVIKDGHVLVVGPTGSGKTTAMRSIIQHRHNVVVIDPHNDSSSWGSLRVIGGGLNFDAIGNYIQSMDTEITKRFSQRLQGKRDFESLTVVVDELPAIIMEIGKPFGAIWAKWIMQGRKVGLYVVMGSQSSRVVVLGIEGRGDILENFNYVITLDKKAQSQYKELVSGMDRPAVIESVDGAFPVIIPNIETVSGRYADVDNLTGYDEEQIITLYLSQSDRKNLAEIQKEIFGYSGGKAYYAVRDVLVKRGLLDENTSTTD